MPSWNYKNSPYTIQHAACNVSSRLSQQTTPFEWRNRMMHPRHTIRWLLAWFVYLFWNCFALTFKCLYRRAWRQSYDGTCGFDGTSLWFAVETHWAVRLTVMVVVCLQESWMPSLKMASAGSTAVSSCLWERLGDPSKERLRWVPRTIHWYVPWAEG